jgi:hypothetical protein
MNTGGDSPQPFDREYEDRLLDLCASGSLDPEVWLKHGEGFFMGGLAVLLAGSRGFDRGAYLDLADQLYPEASSVEVFADWLEQTPVSLSRFLPMARRRKGIE